MTFAEFVALPDQEKVVLVEIKVAREVEHGATWTLGGVAAYYTSFADGEAISVQENGVEYAETFTIGACDALVSSFYYDTTNNRLYVRTSGSDSPDTKIGPDYKYLIIAYFWVLLTNTQPGVIYEKEEDRITDGGLELWTNATTPTEWAVTIAGGTSSANQESAAANVYEGAYSCRLDVDAADNDVTIYQDPVTLRPSRVHSLRFWHKMSAAGITGQIRLCDSATNVYLQDDYTWAAGANWIQLANVTTWTLCEITFTPHPSYDSYWLSIGTESGASKSMYVDDISCVRLLQPIYALPYLGESAIPDITQSVGEYYTGSMEINFGSIACRNDGWWYTALSSYIFHNKELRVLIGALGSDYHDLEPVFIGRTRTPSVNDEQAVLECVDNRVGQFRSIPINKYWVTTYANLESGAEGRPIPILFGAVENITPVCIDITTFKYKIAGHQLQAISNVYKDGTTLTNVTDYAKDLALGEFTLVADPGDALITCDAQGLLCNYTDATYSENIADFLYYVLVTLNGISTTKIDFASFNDLKAGRTQIMAWYLDNEMTTWDFVRLLQASGIFHLIPMLNGRYGAFRYVTGTTSSTPIARQEDYIGSVDITYDTDSAFKKIIIKYDYDPTKQTWAKVEDSDANISRRYDIEETLTIETMLTASAEAAAIATVYQNFTRAPVKKLNTTIPAFALNMKPSDKLICTKVVTDAEGDSITVFNEEVYRVLALNKNLSSGTVGVFGILDSQAVGGTHADTAHGDTHTDTHSDVAHADTAHSDGTYEDHEDVAHSDTHGDAVHGDITHVDGHDDYHSDVHQDTHDDHEDDGYTDSHSDFHMDEHWDYHADTHTDTPHSDSYTDIDHEDAYGDGHGDTAHADTAHTDTHADAHTDVVHVDSLF